MTGAYLGSLLLVHRDVALLRMSASTADPARAADRSVRGQALALSLWTHVKRAWAPIVGLIVIAVLQNIDLIAAKHRFTSNVASSYAATAVAAKVLIWVAMGAGFYLVPEVSRRRAEGQDTRGVLFGRSGHRGRLRGPGAADLRRWPRIPCLRSRSAPSEPWRTASLLPLGAAFTVLASTYLAVQYMLALKRTGFLVVDRSGRGGRARPAAAGLAPAGGFRRRRARRSGGRCAAGLRVGVPARAPGPAGRPNGCPRELR